MVEPLSTRTYLTFRSQANDPININEELTDDIAFLVGPKREGTIKAHTLSPATLLPNYYETLGEVSDKVSFTQNMQQFQRYEHKAKLTKAEKQFHGERQEENGESSEEVKVTRKRKSNPKRNIHHPRISPITVPGTLDNSHESPKRSKRFPEPDYSHRDNNYKQPTLQDRLFINKLFSNEYEEESGRRIKNRGKLTEDDVDFSDDGFVDELFYVGGKTMVNEFKTRKHEYNQNKKTQGEDKRSNSLTLHMKN